MYLGRVQGKGAVTEQLLCPVCGWEYTHCEGAGTLLGNDEAEAEVYPGTKVIGCIEDERRSALVIKFNCEVGHRWRLVIRQHKGVTSIDTLTEVEV